ncbi:MAG: MFS transporter [Gammaproteobacteria bacterium]|nr:MFS transporter [Gammaproteobacteria bacterium]
MRHTFAPLAALLLGVALMLVGNGLQAVLVPFRAGAEMFSQLSIGFIGASYFLGFTIGCLQGGALVRMVGHVRAFAAMTAAASAVPLLQALWVEPVPWFFFRIATGFCFAVLYIVIESWLNERASNENRGTVFSTYIFISFGAMAVGQELLRVYDPSGVELFAVVAALVSLAAIPVALTRSPVPRLPEVAVINLRGLWRVSPSGLAGTLASGLGNGAFWSLAPLVAAGEILDVSRTATFMSVALIGGAAGQFPFGGLSDRVDRRHVIAGVAALAAAVSLAIWLAAGLDTGNLLLYALSFLWGMASFTIYPISVAHSNDHADPDDFVSVSAGLLFAYGAGATVGPVLAALLMSVTSAPTLYLFIAVMYLPLAMFSLSRAYRYAQVPEAEQVAFSDALSASGTASHAYEEEWSEQVLEEQAEATAGNQ